MFGIGMNEFLVLILLALVFIGPKQLPEVARWVGKMMAAFRRATADLRSAVSEEINARPEWREISKLKDEISGDVQHLKHRARDYIDEEFREEQRLAGSMDREVRHLGDRVKDGLDAHSAQPDLGGPPQPESGAPPQAEAEAEPSTPEERAQFDSAYRSFYHNEEAPNAEEVAAQVADAVPSAATADPAADSPEDAYLSEREGAAEGGEAKAGLYLLRSGGRRGAVANGDSAGGEGGATAAEERRGQGEETSENDPAGAEKA